jgi:hypothetical protein
VARYHLIGVDFPWWRLHGIIQIHKYVTENEVPELYSTYCVCSGFYEPLVARFHLTGADFLSNWPHRVILTNEDAMEMNLHHFLQHIVFVSVLISLWSPDLI